MTEPALPDPIVTPGLVLRCLQPEDAAALVALMTPAVSRWVAAWPLPFTPAMAAARIAAAQQAAREGRGLPFAITRRTDAALIGYISVFREADPAQGSLGYWLGEPYQGQGHMREAVPAMLAAGFARLGLSRISAAVQPGNAASIATLRRAGMRPAGADWKHAPSRNRDEWCLLYALDAP